MQFCEKCGAQVVNAGAKFCGECGQALSPPKALPTAAETPALSPVPPRVQAKKSEMRTKDWIYVVLSFGLVGTGFYAGVSSLWGGAVVVLMAVGFVGLAVKDWLSGRRGELDGPLSSMGLRERRVAVSVVGLLLGFGAVSGVSANLRDREAVAQETEQRARDAADLAARASVAEGALRSAVDAAEWEVADEQWSVLRELQPDNAALAETKSLIAPEVERIRGERTEAERLMKVDEGIEHARRVARDKKLCDTPLEISKAWNKLRKVRSGDSQWGSAKKAVYGLEKCRRQVEREMTKALRLVMLAQREQLAVNIERTMLESGMDVRVTLSGKHKDHVRFKWVLMSRPLVHQMTDGGSMNPGALLRNLQDAGFRKVVFADGYNESFSYALEPEPEDKGGQMSLTGMNLGEPLALVK